LISGINRVQAILFGILFYSALALVSGRMAVSGVSDCGCMGSLPVSPWVICGLDVLMAAGLGVALLGGTDRVLLRQGLRRFLASTATIAVIIAAIAFVLVGRFGSIDAALRNWQGHALEVPRWVDSVRSDADGTYRATISVENHGDAAIRIVGAEVCCGARVDAAFPKTVLPAQIDVLLVIMDCERRASLVVTLWVESESKLKKQRVLVSCRRPD
jgi:hypothetical protein